MMTTTTGTALGLGFAIALIVTCAIGYFWIRSRHHTDEIVITSAGNSSQAWWAVTRDNEASFYLDASMSLATMFASGTLPKSELAGGRIVERNDA